MEAITDDPFRLPPRITAVHPDPGAYTGSDTVMDASGASITLAVKSASL